MNVHESLHAKSWWNRMHRCLTITSTMSVMLVLTACGGGGGGGGNNPPPPTPPATGNQAPVVQAGPDQTIQLPTNTAALVGSATDADAGNTLTYAWTATPAGVTFANAAAGSTTATFAGAGTYTLTLTVNDGTTTATDTLSVVVQAASGPANVAPVVDAGADQTVELPTSSVSLQGTATDDQLPAPATLTYSWTVTSGSGVTIADATALATTAQFTNAGAHTLTLTVSDGALSTTDTVQIVVNAAVFPATDWVSATPAEMGLTAAKLDEARDYSLTGGTGGPNLGGSGFIARKGRRVYTWGSQTARYDVKSSSKAIGGIALGLAIDEQRLALANLAKTHLPSLGAVPPATVSADTRVDTITVLQLANHTAGFPKPGGEHALAYDPGTTFLYSDGGLNWLADTLTHVYVQDLNTLLFSRVFTTLGIEAADLQWRNNAFRSDTLDVAGTPVKRREFASGISVNVDAMARIGHLFLRRGLWNDQRLLSESFVDLVRTPGTGISNVTNADPVGYPNVTANYGLLWWTNAAGTLPNVPTDAYWAWGLGDSLIVVIPSLDLVIARTGNSPDNAALPQWRAGWNGDYTVLAPFLNPIVESVAP